MSNDFTVYKNDELEKRLIAIELAIQTNRVRIDAFNQLFFSHREDILSRINAISTFLSMKASDDENWVLGSGMVENNND